MVDDWSDYLAEIPYAQAKENLRRYVLDAGNKYPPHPGALARPLESKSDAERYFEQQQAAGILTLEQWEQLRNNAVGPTDEQRRKVEEIRGRSI